MDLGLKDAAVLVTGGSSGIGRATAVAYAREGARVAITYNSRKDAAEAVAEEIEAAGGTAYVVPMDLNEPETIAGRGRVDGRAVGWARRGGGERRQLGQPGVRRPAGERSRTPSRSGGSRSCGPISRATSTSCSRWRRRCGGRSTAAWCCCRRIWPSVRCPAPGRTARRRPDCTDSSRALQHDLGKDGVLVNIVMPGITLENGEHRVIPGRRSTQIAAGFSARKLPDTTDLADAIVFLTSPRTTAIQGEILRVTGGQLTRRMTRPGVRNRGLAAETLVPLASGHPGEGASRWPGH